MKIFIPTGHVPQGFQRKLTVFLLANAFGQVWATCLPQSPRWVTPKDLKCSIRTWGVRRTHYPKWFWATQSSSYRHITRLQDSKACEGRKKEQNTLAISSQNVVSICQYAVMRRVFPQMLSERLWGLVLHNGPMRWTHLRCDQTLGRRSHFVFSKLQEPLKRSTLKMWQPSVTLSVTLSA